MRKERGSTKRPWSGVITNAKLVTIHGHRCVRGKFVTPITVENGVAINVKGQTFNIGPVTRIRRIINGATLYTAMGRYSVVGDLQ